MDQTSSTESLKSFPRSRNCGSCCSPFPRQKKQLEVESFGGRCWNGYLILFMHFSLSNWSLSSRLVVVRCGWISCACAQQACGWSTQPSTDEVFRFHAAYVLVLYIGSQSPQQLPMLAIFVGQCFGAHWSGMVKTMVKWFNINPYHRSLNLEDISPVYLVLNDHPAKVEMSCCPNQHVF